MDKKPILNQVVLQTMACTLDKYDFNDLRSLYVAYNLPITPIEKITRTWLDEKLVEGDLPRRYTNKYVVINPEIWADVMRTISPNDLETLFATSDKCGKAVPVCMQGFLRAFCNAMQGRPFEDIMEGISWSTASWQMPNLVYLLAVLSYNNDCLPLLQHLPGDLLQYIYYYEYVYEWWNLLPVKNMDNLRALFFDNQFLPRQLRDQMRDAYLYNVEFLQTGKLKEVLAKMQPGGRYYNKLLALLKLHEGNPAGALELLQPLLKESGNDSFDEPLTNFVYGLALGQCVANPPGGKLARGVLRKAEALMKSRKVAADETCYPLRLALHHYVAGNAETFIGNNLLTASDGKMCLRLGVLFVHHYQLSKTKDSEMSEYLDEVLRDGYNYISLLYSLDYDQLQSSREKLGQETGLTTSLMPMVKRLAPWERIIEELLRINRPVATAKAQTVKQQPTAIERVAYMINFDNYAVHPKLQKSKDGGITWSKGRNIALSTFKSDGSGYMTEQDHRVARMVQRSSYGWYNQTYYNLSGINVIAALAGCPSVYNENTGLQVDIVEEELTLSVQPCEGGYKVVSNVNLSPQFTSDIYLSMQGDRQATIIRINAKQLQTLKLLKKIEVFPKESKPQLLQLIQNLSDTFTVMSPLLKNSTDLKRVEASSLIAVQITPTQDQMFSIALAVKPFGDHPPYQQPGQGVEIVSTKIDGERVQTERNMKKERERLKAVRELMQPFAHSEVDENRWLLDTAQCLQLLDALRTAPKVAFVEWPQGVKMRVARPTITPDKLWIKISSTGQWFEIEGDVNIGNKEKIKMAELLERLQQAKGNFIRLNDDEYIALSDQLRRQLEAIDKMLTGRGKQLKMAAMNGFQLEGLEALGAKVDADEPFRQLVGRIKESATMSIKVPGNIHAELRPYQVEGFEWMSRLASWGAGACLADDMGLGKTLQAITLMQSRASLGAALVLVPTSVLHNWQAELGRFAPAMTVKILNQPSAARQPIVRDASAGDVVLSTYGLLVTEGELLTQRTWSTVVLDEAHTIKNRDTQTSKAAMRLQADFRLMLTGTPLQNHLSEIWNLFQFANPGLLGSFQQFTDRFIMPIERDHNRECQWLLRRLISPFLLRRTKDDVLNELPEKTEITLRVELSEEEKALYDNLREQAIANLEEGSSTALQTLAEITRLRQAACHPRLVNAKLQIASSKTAAFLELVEELRLSGHRTLVFSQFTSHLALIREALDAQQTRYLYLDGNTTAAERTRLVRQFQTGDEQLFLISLKAGGLGLNLTAADYVIHLDPWWNPAVEDQASDRAHRIGQERPVTVYRLIAAGTIEEKIIRLHHNKRSMADALLEGSDMGGKVSADDVIRLLREGADAITW